jgi:hypothetical protein
VEEGKATTARQGKMPDDVEGCKAQSGALLITVTTKQKKGEGSILKIAVVIS